MTRDEIRAFRTAFLAIVGTLIAAGVVSLTSWAMGTSTSLERHEVLLQQMHSVVSSIEDLRRTTFTRAEWQVEKIALDERLSRIELRLEELRMSIDKMIK